MKKIYLFAAMATMLAACSSDKLPQEQAVAPQNVGEGAVMFDAYTQRTVTRAGVTGALKTADLIDTSSDFGQAGFGVFGYYTDNSTYDQQAIPNFFYNQQVTYNGSYFEYSPVKYWPNEYGTSAVSEDQDKVSFFAYAPYVKVSPSTGKVVDPSLSPSDPDYNTKAAELQKWGINSLSRNSATGDPIVKYIASFDQDKSVDLLWGVCGETTWPLVVDGKSQNMNIGLPWLDVQRPADPTKLGDGQKVKFTFKHATSQLKVMIDAFVDGTDNTNQIATETKVYVRSISFEGFAMKGALNLNNTEAGTNKAYWMDYNGANDLVTGEAVTIYDGRKDGKEGTPSGEATNEKTLGLNPDIVQSTVWTPSEGTAMPGVTDSPKNLFRKYDGSKYVAADAPIYVIPTGDPVRVTIVYDIETADGNLSTYVSDAIQTGSSIENCISKDINFGGANNMENGKSYIINLHLGMNSVKFDAAVTDWVETTDAHVNLPANVPVYEAAATAENKAYSVTLPADVTEYKFAISGLNGGESLTVEPTSPVTGTYTVTADATGVALITAQLTANNTVNKTITGKIVVTGATKKATINIEQAPAPLGLKIASVDFSNKDIILDADATVTWSDIPSATNIKVEKNGVKLAIITTGSPTSAEVLWTSGDHKLTFKDNIKTGDTYTITVKAGTAPEETITYKVKAGSLSFAQSNVTVSVGAVFTKEVTKNGDGTITYNSTDEDVATVNSSTGQVTAKAAGTCTITATVSGNSDYYESTQAEYELTVTP